MAAPTQALDLKAVANEVVASLADHRQIPTFSSRPGGLTLAQAYRITPLLRAAFEARDEKITGRKIGFTNREMWKVYGVQSPIWGYTTSHTTRELAHTQAICVKDFAEPRIEPEIMFGLKAAPMPGMSDATLCDCIEWISLGYEIVQITSSPHSSVTYSQPIQTQEAHHNNELPHDGVGNVLYSRQ